jgi:hypothetical protein
VGKSGLEAFELGDSLVNAHTPISRKLRPISTFRNTVSGQLRQLVADLLQGQPYLLSEDDERDAAENCARVAPMASP